MDFSDPFRGMGQGRPLSASDVAAALRIDVAAELDAVNLYQAHIDAISDPKLRATIEEIRDDEKNHAAKFLAALNEIDAGQAAQFGGKLPSPSEVPGGSGLASRMTSLEQSVQSITERLDRMDGR